MKKTLEIIWHGIHYTVIFRNLLEIKYSDV